MFAKCCDESGIAFLHFILEDYASNNNTDTCGQVPHESKGRSSGGDIAGYDHALQSDEGRLEIGTHANAGNDLEENDFGPVGFSIEVDEESEAEGHEDESEPDGWEVFAGFLNEDACCATDERKGECEWKQIHAREERSGSQYGLKVEGEVVGACDEDVAVAETDTEGGDITAEFEQAEGHHGISRKFPLVDYEEASDEDAENDQADDLCRAPGICDTAKFETQEKHQRATNDAETANPINRFETIPDRCPWIVEVQEEEEEDEDSSRNGHYVPLAHHCNSKSRVHLRLR